MKYVHYIYLVEDNIIFAFIICLNGLTHTFSDLYREPLVIFVCFKLFDDLDTEHLLKFCNPKWVLQSGKEMLHCRTVDWSGAETVRQG